MKKLTFDVPAYKFALVFPRTSIDFKELGYNIDINGHKLHVHGEEQFIAANEFDLCNSFDENEPYFGFCKDKDNNLLRIPFTDVDGLTVEEFLEFTNILVVMVSYGVRKPFKGWPNHFKVILTGYLQGPKDYMDMHLNELLLPSYWQKENYNQRFDKVIEQILMEDYPKFQGIEQKMANCLFERYQDGNYEDTLRRVKSLKQSR